MIRLLLGIAFAISLFSLPWWISTGIAIFFLSAGGNPFLVVLGGLILDRMFGAPLGTLAGLSHFYTVYFALLAALSAYLRITLLA
ncbi:MAG: hypothetical protein JO026_02640 [Patescibacteria group bacterium]|nr:hypothetical protein [Patescibacteria group bacterium]